MTRYRTYDDWKLASPDDEWDECNAQEPQEEIEEPQEYILDTAEQHVQRIRQLEFMLEKADYGMGMPRDYQRVLELRVMLEQARKQFDQEWGL